MLRQGSRIDLSPCPVARHVPPVQTAQLSPIVFTSDCNHGNDNFNAIMRYKRNTFCEKKRLNALSKWQNGRIGMGQCRNIYLPLTDALQFQ